MPAHRTYRILGDTGVELLSASYRGQRFVPHAHDHLVLAVTEQGQAVVKSAARCERLGPGSLLVIPPDVVHEAASVGAEPWIYRAFYLSARTMIQHAPWTRHQEELEPAVAVVQDSRFAARLVELHRSIEPLEDLKSAEAVLVSLGPDLGAMIERAFRLRYQAAAPPDAVIAAKARIDAEPERRWTLRDLASAVGQSRFHLCRSFHRHIGATPYAYALQRRVGRARERLGTTTRISLIAQQLGFADQSHLTRLFLQVFGLTPGEYRRSTISGGG